MLLLVTVLATAFFGAFLLPASPEPDTQRVSLSASANATADRIALTHRGGDTLTVSDLRLEIHVAGEPLAKQPPIPFFAASGFESGPTGPFNPATDGEWASGQTATLRIAGTNSPQPQPGDQVTIHLYTEGQKLATVTVTA
jgi:FlaG/FlaF family flagellin (archaellin)